MLATGPVQKAGLDPGVPPCRGLPRLLGILFRWFRLDIVLAVESQPLNDLNGVLLVGLQVRIRGFEERSRHLGRSVHGIDRPVALKTGDGQLGFDRLRHCTSSEGTLCPEVTQS